MASLVEQAAEAFQEKDALRPSDKTRRWVIEPGKSKKLAQWDMYIALLLSYVAIITPFEVAFLETKMNWMFIVNRFIDVSFILDMIVQFFIAYIDIDTGAWEYSPPKIASRYLRSWFSIDLASILPFDTLGVVTGDAMWNDLKVLRVIRFLRLLKLVKIFAGQERLQVAIAKLGVSFASLELFKMCGGVLLVAHWFACTWYLTATFDTENHNWVVVYGYQDSDNLTKYIAAYYWAIYTMVTIGYGDMGSTNVGERIVATVTMMIGGGMYSYIVGSVCGIVESSDRGTTDYHQAMDNLNRYMAEEHVPQRTQLSLRLYFVQCKSLHMDKYNMEVLENMSPGLQRQLAGHMHGTWMGNISFFTTGGSRDHEFATAVALQMSTLALPSQELLIREGESAINLYIVRRGLVGCHGRVFRKGKVLGNDMIMGTSVKRPYRGLCLTFTDVMVLSHDSLHEVLDCGFREHAIKIKSAAAWLNVKNTFLQTGRLMLRIRALTGDVPQFDNPRDTLVYIQRLRIYSAGALIPEQLTAKDLPDTDGEYMEQLLIQQEKNSADQTHRASARGFERAEREIMQTMEDLVTRRFSEIADTTISRINGEINTIAMTATLCSTTALVVGLLWSAPN